MVERTQRDAAMHLTPGEPPRDPSKQYLAWAVSSDAHERGELCVPLWCVAQWNSERPPGCWCWYAPPLVIPVHIIEYVELPRLDFLAAETFERLRKREKTNG